MPSIEDLVVSCLEVPASERFTKLEAVCASYPELADGLRRMLAQLEQMGFLADGAAPEPRRTGAWGLPEMLGSYRLGAPIGRGGMGVVYRARQTSLGNRVVALKLIRPDLVGSSKAQARFLREALLASRLDHPNVCGVLEVGQHEGLAWLAMPFVEGETLAERIAETRDRREQVPRALPRLREGKDTSLDDLLVAFAALGRGLSHAHDRGLVHRDVKPSNVMVQPGGDLVLLDFGLARECEPGTRLTLSQDLIGTPAYMAPEQAAQRADLDARADVYSLGASLYECLSLELPHPAPTREEMLQRILHDAAPDPRRLTPWLPRPVADVVRGALEPDRARRYQTASAFGDDLQRVLDQRPITIRRPTASQRAAFWVRRNPWPTAAGAILASACLVSAALAAVALGAARRSHAGDLLGQSFAAMDHDELAAHRLAIAADRQHSTFRTRDQLHRTMRTMRLVASVAIDKLATLALTFDRKGQRLCAVYPRTVAVLAIVEEDGRWSIRTEHQLATPQTAQAVIADSSGLEVLMAGQDGVLRRWRPGSAIEELPGPRATPRPSYATFTCSALDARGSQAYFGDSAGHVYRIDLAADASVDRWSPAGEREAAVGTCTVLAEGWVATTRSVGQAGSPASELVARRGDQVLGPFRLDGLVIHAAAGATGTRIWLARGRRGLSLHDLETGRLVPPEYEISDLAITALASGRDYVYAGCVDGTVHRLSHDGSKPPLIVRRHKGAVDPIVIEPSGDSCVSCGYEDMTIQIADPRGRPLEPPLRGSNSAVFDVAVDPSGRLLAASTWSGAVQIMRRGDPTPSLQHPAGPHFDGFQFVGSSGWVVIAGSEVVAYRGHPDTRVLESPGQVSAKGSRRAPPGALSVPLLAVRGDRLARSRLRYLSIHDPEGRELCSTELPQPIYGVDFLADDLVWVALNGGPQQPPRFQTFRLATAAAEAGLRLELASDVAIPDPWPELRYFWQRASTAPDGSFYVACCNDGTVRAYSPDGRRIGEPLVHAADVSSSTVRFAAISPDGSRLLSSGTDGRVKWWRRQADGTFAFEGRITELPTDAGFVAFDPAGKRIVVTSHSGVVRVLDLEGAVLEEYRIDSVPRCCRFSPDGSRLGATTEDGRFVTWFLDHGELLRRAEALLPQGASLEPPR